LNRDGTDEMVMMKPREKNNQGLGQGTGIRYRNSVKQPQGACVELRKERAWQQSPVRETPKTALDVAVSSIKVTV
jgi:hypothetical protein